MQAPVGILGGTFDPIHFGHLRMAQELYEALALAQVRFIPAATPPHRTQPRTDSAHRSEMVRCAIAGNSAFGLDLRELERAGPSFSFDTLSELRAELGESVPLCLMIGSDAFLGLDTWHRWRELTTLAHIVVAHRPGATPHESSMTPALLEEWQANPAELHALPCGKMLLHPITALDISASAIRNALMSGHSPRYLLPDAVLDYIDTHHLYQKDPNET